MQPFSSQGNQQSAGMTSSQNSCSAISKLLGHWNCHVNNFTSTAKPTRHCSVNPQAFLNLSLVPVYFIVLHCNVPTQCPNSTYILPCLQLWSAVHSHIGRCCRTHSPAAGLTTCCGCRSGAWSSDSNLCEGFSGLTYGTHCTSFILSNQLLPSHKFSCVLFTSVPAGCISSLCCTDTDMKNDDHCLK